MTAGSWLVQVARGRAGSIAVVLLVAANLVPLAGVLWFGWDVGTILYAYWIENGIVGLLNVPKMLMARGRGPLATVGAADGICGRGILVGFFLVHYGIFWVVHGVFVSVLAQGNFLAFGFGNPIATVLSDRGLLLAAAALLVSHMASFVLNYIGRGEYKTATVGGQMFAPYVRVFVLHIVVILGGAVLIGLRQPVVLVVLLVVLKTAIDLGLHLREHRARAASAGSAPPPPSAGVV